MSTTITTLAQAKSIKDCILLNGNWVLQSNVSSHSVISPTGKAAELIVGYNCSSLSIGGFYDGLSQSTPIPVKVSVDDGNVFNLTGQSGSFNSDQYVINTSDGTTPLVDGPHTFAFYFTCTGHTFTLVSDGTDSISFLKGTGANPHPIAITGINSILICNSNDSAVKREIGLLTLSNSVSPNSFATNSIGPECILDYSDKGFYFRATCSSIQLWTKHTGTPFSCFKKRSSDNSAPTLVSSMVLPSDSGEGWVTIASGLDSTTEYFYEIITDTANTDVNTPAAYVSQVKALGGTGISSTNPPKRQCALVLGDSIVAGSVLIDNGFIQPRVVYTRQLLFLGFCLATFATGGIPLHNNGTSGVLANLAYLSNYSLDNGDSGGNSVVIWEVGTNDRLASLDAESAHRVDVKNAVIWSRNQWPNAKIVFDSIFPFPTSGSSGEIAYNTARQEGVNDAIITGVSNAMYHYWGDNIPSAIDGFFSDNLHLNPKGNSEVVYPTDGSVIPLVIPNVSIKILGIGMETLGVGGVGIGCND